ncbi:hypothetical protein GCM10028791_38550 [Echinicola sediminis]
MKDQNQEIETLGKIVEMINSMAKKDFSNRLRIEVSDEPINLIAYGLNMLSEELETNLVQKSLLKEINDNLEKFTLTVAHEIKSPLNSSSGLISLIEDEIQYYENPELKKYLEILKQINERTRKMVNEILAYSKTHLDWAKLDHLNLSEVSANLAKEYAFDNRIKIHFNEHMPTIIYNESALLQLMGNLISNAVKYNDKALCEIFIECEEKERHYVVSVSDNGPGINNENKVEIFNLYENFQSHREDSTGIGLAIIKKIVNQLKGEIWVESNPGNGSKFNFTILKQKLR